MTNTLLTAAMGGAILLVGAIPAAGQSGAPGLRGPGDPLQMQTPGVVPHPHRAFYFAPPEIREGDHVMVATRTAPVQRGYEVLASLAAGQRLQVLEVRGPWVGVALQTPDGRPFGGWVRMHQLALAPDVHPEEGVIPPPVAARVYQRFAFEADVVTPGVPVAPPVVERRTPEYLRADSKIQGRFGRYR